MTDPIMSADRYRTRIPHWVNQQRGRHELMPPLQRRPNLTAGAQDWCDVLSETDLFKHQDLAWVLGSGASWAGECLALIPDGVTPRQTVRLWMRSPAHRALVLKTRATHAGVGATWDTNRRAWVISLVLAEYR